MDQGPKATAKERRHVFYDGRVQGVGFRYTAYHLARKYPGITGFVRNLPDGRVELLAEGPAEDLERFLGDIRAEMGRFIRGEDVTKGVASGNFDRFEIRY
ncbi:MAG: acylphosphatase [Thermoguttaceae bacterium]|nr:acylphosphatase [Thermoguttaceae bacterium]MDW8078956.1 acylphosphatase [Thermoguttaceae bacterium]